MLLIVLLVSVVTVVTGGLALAADTGSTTTPGEGIAAALGGSWLVTIEGEKRTRTLTVNGLAPTGFGAAGPAATLNGTYGYSDANPSAVKVYASGTLEAFEISFQSSARAKLHARTVSPSELRGTFEFKGETRALTITRAPVTAVAKRDSKITFVYIGAFN